ncbi:ribosomal protein L21-like protein [Boletus edulis BED1]|uniref:Large ribosomal subunit protein bL21m n=1 Tax=Boletus edulis BED1 TaxID=1328754 RepID=A0AAD4C5W8_BOLED|nr:ribosomal protein L21-like protein [Boletus edulis BED1]
MATWQIRSWLSQTLRKVATSSLHSAPDSAAAALSLIRSQPSQYVIASVVGRKYILTPRDILTVPRLKDVCVGDVLHLRDLHEIGTREYTLRGDPLPRNHIKVEATVIEQTKGKMEVVFKKKRRKGYQKTIKNKHPYTRLRIGPIQFTNLPLSS